MSETNPSSHLARQLFEAALQSNTDECIVWPYATKRGYAAIKWQGKMVAAHRLILIVLQGDQPGLDAAHDCGVSLCINPRHLVWKTRQENIDDKKLHGTDPIGEANGRAMLTEQDVRNILVDIRPQREIARAYGMSASAVNHIKTGRTWKHIRSSR